MHTQSGCSANDCAPSDRPPGDCPPIFLVGPRCSGKTTLAGLLAQRFGLSCRDTDAILCAEAGLSVAEIVRREGWAAFRERESRALRAAAIPGAVVGTGGGVVLDPANRTFMRASGLVMYLEAPAALLAGRLAHDRGIYTEQGRPSLTGEDPEQEMAQVLAERAPLYRESAHYTVDAAPPVQTVLEAISALLKQDIKI